MTWTGIRTGDEERDKVDIGTERNRTVLVVIDMQQKYLPMYDAGLVERVNAVINAYHEAGVPVLYVKNIGKPENAAQYELAENLVMVSDQIFEKRSPSAFSSEAFVRALERLHADMLEIAGVDGNCCVAQAAMDAAKRGYQVRVLVGCVGFRNEKIWDKTVKKLEKIKNLELSGETRENREWTLLNKGKTDTMITFISKKYEGNIKLFPPTDMEEDSFAITLPEQLRKVLQESDGIMETMQNPATNEFIDIGWILYPLSEICKETIFYRKEYYVAGVVFADDGAGNPYYIKNNNKVYQYECIDSEELLVAESLEEFFRY